jgi:esterase/lipase superfamily enzyme
LIGHSLGARVVLNALQSLHNNQEWRNEKFKVTSVHLLGGAVDNEEVSKDSWDIVSDPTNFNGTFTMKFPYGNAIQDEASQSKLHT